MAERTPPDDTTLEGVEQFADEALELAEASLPLAAEILPEPTTAPVTAEDRERIAEERVADIRARCICDRSVPAAEAEVAALTTELGHVQGTLSDTRQEVDDLTAENLALRAQLDALKAAIERVRKLAEQWVAQATPEQAGDLLVDDLVSVLANVGRTILAALAVPESTEDVSRENPGPAETRHDHD